MFQSPCGDSMWTTFARIRGRIAHRVSIPLRGFHVDNESFGEGITATGVSIPLRGFHVDNEVLIVTTTEAVVVSIPLRGFHVDNTKRT